MMNTSIAAWYPSSTHSYSESSGFKYKEDEVEIDIQFDSTIAESPYGGVCPAKDCKDQNNLLVAKFLLPYKKIMDEVEYDFFFSSLKKESEILELLTDNPLVGVVRSPRIFFQNKKTQPTFLILYKYEGNLEDNIYLLNSSLMYQCFEQILKGLNCLYKHGISHGDISLSNCLVRFQPSFECVLADFDCACLQENKPSSFAISEYYPKNEVNFNKTLWEKCNEPLDINYKENLKKAHIHRLAMDVQAFGILMKKLFNDRTNLIPQLEDLINQMCVPNWNDRITIENALLRWKKIKVE